MIGRLLDNIVSIFSPGTGYKRAYLRRAYDAAKRDRLSANWKTSNESADLALFSDADVVRDRARDLVRNNAYARGALRSAVRNVVGQGIRPQCRVRRGNGDENTKFCEQAEALFERWQQQCDVAGRLSFYEMQQLAISERWEAGECLLHFVRDNSQSRPVPLALELIEAERLASDNDTARYLSTATGNEVRRGVELDASGRAVAYHLYTSHPNGVHSFRHEVRRYPAEEFLHIYRQSRIGQTRGVSEFAPVVFWMRNIHKAMDHEMVARSIANCFTVAIKSTGGPADGIIGTSAGGDTSDQNGNGFEFIEPGMVARLFPDEDISVINPGRNAPDSQAWITLMVRSMAVGMGLSYERLSRDYSTTNYSSNRASDLEDRREFRTEQQWLIQNMCRPVWRRFMAAAVEDGVQGFPQPADFLGNYDRWTEHSWNPPGWEWVDPVKEMQASRDAIASNLSTQAIELAERGLDWRDVVRQRAIENAVTRTIQADVNAQFGLAAESKPTERLNGAQVQSATQIVAMVASGQMPRDAGVGQLVVLFQLSQEEAELMMGSAGAGFVSAAETPSTQQDTQGDDQSPGDSEVDDAEEAAIASES